MPGVYDPAHPFRYRLLRNRDETSRTRGYLIGDPIAVERHEFTLPISRPTGEGNVLIAACELIRTRHDKTYVEGWPPLEVGDIIELLDIALPDGSTESFFFAVLPEGWGVLTKDQVPA